MSIFSVSMVTISACLAEAAETREYGSFRSVGASGATFPAQSPGAPAQMTSMPIFFPASASISASCLGAQHADAGFVVFLHLPFSLPFTLTFSPPGRVCEGAIGEAQNRITPASEA